jgi:hypothetical protein
MTTPHLSADRRRIMFGPELMKAGQETTFVFVPVEGRAWRSQVLTIAGRLDLLRFDINRIPQLAPGGDPVPAEVLEHGLVANFTVAPIHTTIEIKVRARDEDTFFGGTIAGQILD